MKLKVLDISERPITFTQSVIRSLPQMLPLFITAGTLSQSILSESENEFKRDLLGFVSGAAYVAYFVWYIVDILVCVYSEKNRALHDLIAGTVVVKTNIDQMSVTP